ncbi:MAG: hypothetical protein GX139_00490 [Armatimonadetes bacterium]|jgi:hypothetical protein|nr:hypothetical protein [Armatimonadota bacterium]
MKTGQRRIIGGVLFIGVALMAAGMAFAQGQIPANYPSYTTEAARVITLENEYIAAKIGVSGKVVSRARSDDDDVGARDDKVITSETDHDWGIAGRWGVVSKKGDPENPADDNMPLTFMGFMPCHYFGYWKLRIGDEMRMIGDGSTGGWYSTGDGQPGKIPTLIDSGKWGPYIEGTWRVAGSDVLVKIRIELVRDLVRFEYEITNTGIVTQNIGFQQYGDVETGAPIVGSAAETIGYGYYINQNYAFIPGIGATQPITKQKAMIFGGRDPEDNKLNPAVPDWFEVYDDISNPGNVTRNVLGLEDATRPNMVAIGEHVDLYHKNLWLPTDYRPEKPHTIFDMAWLLCWEQKLLAPGATRKIVTYYGLGSSTSRWTHQVGSKTERDTALLSVQAPKSLKYDSMNAMINTPELYPSMFNVKAYVYNLTTELGPYELREATATISLPQGLELVSGLPGNTASQRIEEVVERNMECTPVEWTVRATGEYAGELPIYVSVADNDPTGKYWQQSVKRTICIPATKGSYFDYGWQLMHVPFAFNNPYFLSDGNPLGLTPGLFGAQYYDTLTNRYYNISKLTPGQGFWIYVGGLSWNERQSFRVNTDAAIVGEGFGSGKQTVEQYISLKRGWNIIGNPFVYPVYWGQVKVHYGNDTWSLADAVSKGWMDGYLFSWNTTKWAYDISNDKSTLMNPWSGYWVRAKQPVTLVFRPPVFPGGDVTANPGGN